MTRLVREVVECALDTIQLVTHGEGAMLNHPEKLSEYLEILSDDRHRPALPSPPLLRFLPLPQRLSRHAPLLPLPLRPSLPLALPLALNPPPPPPMSTPRLLLRPPLGALLLQSPSRPRPTRSSRKPWAPRYISTAHTSLHEPASSDDPTSSPARR
ncbi:hypothetical protein sr17502 [Sporisorium reilianum SRZ2]|uniref:Uncharacterized protein n=1 Tax=Sporisorium reilianum (strain SRZ2) TaxID=999809 RepID=E6ZQE5_SPORE|nr:hypothetical protein sr17502 [Sporisorium reilianum SRZ2]